MSSKRSATVASERHRVRIVQQVPAGTPGATVDAITGRSWVAAWLDGGHLAQAGWVSCDLAPTLNDAGEVTLAVPPTGPDGRQASDRFYCLAGSIDPATGERIAYFPGDEWVEVYRRPQELLGNGTPINVTQPLDMVTLQCRDVMQPLKKTRETSGGFWAHAPRDVLEHYTRLWLPVIAGDFPDSLTQFPGSPGSGTTPDGLWSFDHAFSSEPGLVTLQTENTLQFATLQLQHLWPDGGAVGHDCWRAEARITALNLPSGGELAFEIVSGSTKICSVALSRDGSAQVSSEYAYTVPPPPGTHTDVWPTDTTGLQDTDGRISAPYTITVEARDRWVLAYLDGQLISAIPRLTSDTGLINASVNLFGVIPATATVDYIVVRRTSAPLNGGDPGDYHLPSKPAAGGLTGEYFDLSNLGQYAIDAGSLVGSPIAPGRQGERVDQFPLTAANPPAWQWNGLSDQWAVVWTGAIYLPLDTQDVHLTVPGGGQVIRAWVGKTRAGEQILDEFSAGSTLPGTSVGMRSLFGSIPGWYPIRIEFFYAGGLGDPNITWDVGGAGTAIPSSMLAPLGCFRGQVPAGDSHYDTFRQTAEQFAYQWRTRPARLEDPSFPGTIVPVARVGRDTAHTLTIDEAIGPQLQVNYEDVAAALLAAAQGLGGNNASTLTLEAFDFAALARHPFISQESENLPTTTVYAQLLSTLLTLLGFRTSGWEDVQASVPGVREKVDTFPLTGELANFDWQPGDGLRVRCPAISVDDDDPRQIFSLKRTVLPDGQGVTQASFRPRNRDVHSTLRKFIREVYGDRRTFQGQLVTAPASAASAPNDAVIALPHDLSTIRRAELVVTAKQDTTTPFNVLVNGSVVFQITRAGRYQLGSWIARQPGTQQMTVHLVNTTMTACTVTYQPDFKILIPRF